MIDALRTDKRFQKVAIGLALENALSKGRDDPLLEELYHDPSTEKISRTYRRLIASGDHNEREMAFWLELGLSQEPTTFPDRLALLTQIRRMETILYDLLGRAGPDTSQPLNDWLNYIANAGESMSGGYWIDAKILMSRAVDSSEETLTKVSAADVKTRHELEILRSETRRDFEELLKASFRLKLPEKRLDVILAVQETLIEMLRLQLKETTKAQTSLLRYIVERLATAEKVMLQEGAESMKALGEIEQVLDYLDSQAPLIDDRKTRKWAEKVRGELGELFQKVR